MPTTTRLTMKQSKCRHPAGAILRGVDESLEVCARCGLVRVAHFASPWLIAYEADEAAKAPPDLMLVSAPVPTFTRKRRAAAREG
jgi:hypothetical protein